MVVGQLLSQIGKYAIPRTKQAYDLVYAVGAGTAAGIGFNPNVREAYEIWRGRYTPMSWRDKAIRRHLKGDIDLGFETSNTQQQTLRPDEPFYNRSRGKTGYSYYRYGKSRRQKYRIRSRRRCSCKSRIHRNVAHRKYRKRYTN